MSSMCRCWRPSSAEIARDTSGSSSLSGAVFSMGEKTNGRPKRSRGKTFFASSGTRGGALGAAEDRGGKIPKVGDDRRDRGHHLVAARLVRGERLAVGI